MNNTPRKSPSQTVKNGVLLHIKTIPNAKTTKLQGLVEDEKGMIYAKIRVATPPEDGKANKALIRFLAKGLGVTATDFSIEKGETSRTKTLLIQGNSEAIACTIQNWLDG